VLFTLVLVGLSQSKKDDRDKRGTFSFADTFESLKIPHGDTQLFDLGVDTFLPIPQGDLIHSSKGSIIPVASSNSVEKPVQEPQEPIPQQPTGTAIIPLIPPPAVPVNAAASNVPSNNGATFLGSGALGVVNLGNGAFALGSGGIGYSNVRQQPRPNGNSPLYPLLPASPHLLPAATPSQQIPPGFQFTPPLFKPNDDFPKFPGISDPNGYEPLDPRNVRFGAQNPRKRPIKIRMNFATPTVPQVQVQPVHPSQRPQPGFGDPIPRLPAHSVTYYKK
ncbi:hypothetical protein GWI33_000831, partial [Rhynchophorus ferrugineus]